VGLDAVVYRNRKHIEMGPDNARANVFHKTAELYFEDDKNDKLLRKYQHKIQAVAHRLGNVALISTLNDEVSQLIGPESFLGRKILYSGTAPVMLYRSRRSMNSRLRSTVSARPACPRL
jgi:hypothetical protein